MINECRELCRKYTVLTENQIDFISSFLDKLQDIADKEESNVYIDCLTFNENFMIVIGEARPINAEPIYRESLIGLVIKTYKEPAVERAFRIGVPTVGVLGKEMPTADKVIQSAFPIIFEGDVIAVLIYEKKFEQYLPVNSKNPAGFLDLQTEQILCNISEAIVIVDEDGYICYSNKEADRLLSSLGYVDAIIGMKSENIISSAEGDHYRFQMSGHTLEGRKFKLVTNSGKICIAIKDITDSELLGKENKNLLTAYQELKHSMKNSLMLLKNICEKKEEKAPSNEAKEAYREMSNRIMSLMTTLELKLKVEEREVNIKSILTELCNRLISLEADPDTEITLSVEGEDILFGDEITNAVVLVVYELICNILKYAFKSREYGKIRIRIMRDYVISYIIVEDDGCGYEVSKENQKSVGLSLIRAIVEDRLNGSLIIESSNKGTKVTFDIME